MQTEIYILPKKTFSKWTVGLNREDRSVLKPRISFWNPAFPTTYLKPNSDIHAREFMIELPLPKWKRKWQRLALRVFNFKIGRLQIVSTDKDDAIKRWVYLD